MTEIGERGRNVSGGQKQRISLARALYSKRDIMLLDDPLSAVDQHVGRTLFKRCIRRGMRKDKKAVLFVTHQLQYLYKCDLILVMSNGVITQKGTYSELLKDFNGEFYQLITSHIKTEESENDGSANESTDGSTSASEDFGKSEVAQKRHSTQDTSAVIMSRVVKKENNSTGAVSKEVYINYAKASGGVSLFVLLLALFILGEAMKISTDLWFSHWSQESTDPNSDQEYYVKIYALLVGVFVAVSFIRGLYLFFLLLKASMELHNQAFYSLMRTHLSFFEANPTGQMLNRFGTDVDACDTQLPQVGYNSLFTVVQMAAMIVTIAFTFPAFLLLLIPLALLFTSSMSMFRYANRDLKRLDSATKTPACAMIVTTLQGIPSTRSYERQ
eukprot:TRINITY_DN5639_c0_g1_i1.p1 TRINITY_DN5639_c0_g1~~TRINITY_DN5639_c0_g1_i1.p1  ORF type:complete len:386 (+),score=71.96 TRINITY_DN5639_c0_g1_i1:73-1230(+)